MKYIFGAAVAFLLYALWLLIRQVNGSDAESGNIYFTKFWSF